jgi:hypothetical protein
MIARAVLIAWLAGVGSLLAPAAASAHRMNVAMSLIEVSPRSGRLEITHTLFAHDLEGALLAGAVSLSWLESPQGQQALRAYCLRQFTLTNQSGRPLALSFVGAELRGDVINIYFDAPRYAGTSLIVDSNLLQDISDSQVNQVNVRAAGKTVSATFGAGAQAVRLAVPR